MRSIAPKALVVSPLKSSQTLGAALAVLGVAGAVPLMHGSQGCTAFAKVFLVRHFREPVPLQTTAMDQIASVMGADENLIEALDTICRRSQPALIGLLTTGLSETQGTDVRRVVQQFRLRHPQWCGTAVVIVESPDFSGGCESGFAATVRGLLDTLVPEGHGRTGQRQDQVNVLCGAGLTPGDLEFVRDSIESFGLRALLIPDLSGSLDGHLGEVHFSPVTTGGVRVEDLCTASESIATLAIGESMQPVARWLEERNGVKALGFGHLQGLDAVDAWFMALSQLAGRPVPACWQRQRRQLLDAMLDSHFTLGQARVAIATEADVLGGMQGLLESVGAEVVAAVVPVGRSGAFRLGGGDLDDLERLAREEGAELVIGSSHAAGCAKRLGLPLLRVGFPQHDRLGGFQRCWFGYRGTAQALFDVGNLLIESHVPQPPYRSIYAGRAGDLSSPSQLFRLETTSADPASAPVAPQGRSAS